jgi:hypothetical protein
MTGVLRFIVLASYGLDKSSDSIRITIEDLKVLQGWFDKNV